MAKPDQRPEGKLLHLALKKSGFSARKAAEMIGLSDTRLRHILNGFQPVGSGQYIGITAPADTVARIAMALEVEPEDLRVAGRGDAADVLVGMNDTSRDRQSRQHPGRLQLTLLLTRWLDDGDSPTPPRAALRLWPTRDVLEDLQDRWSEMEKLRGLHPEGGSDDGDSEDQKSAGDVGGAGEGAGGTVTDLPRPRPGRPTGVQRQAARGRHGPDAPDAPDEKGSQDPDDYDDTQPENPDNI